MTSRQTVTGQDYVSAPLRAAEKEIDDAYVGNLLASLTFGEAAGCPEYGTASTCPGNRRELFHRLERGIRDVDRCTMGP